MIFRVPQFILKHRDHSVPKAFHGVSHRVGTVMERVEYVWTFVSHTVQSHARVALFRARRFRLRVTHPLRAA